jgi:copper transport protein
MSRVRSPVRALRRTVPRTLFVAGVAVLGMAWLAPAAWGHASLDHAVPTPQEELRAPPTLLLLFFDERVSLPFSQVTVTANAGGGGPNLVAGPLRFVGTVGADVLVPLRPGPRGSYTVRWRVLSPADGHVAQGAFTYGVGVPAQPPAVLRGGPPPVGDDVMRWLIFVGLALAGGSLAFRALVWRPALRAAGAGAGAGGHGTDADADANWARQAEGKWFAVAALVGAVIALHAELYAFLASAHAVTGGPLGQFAGAEVQPLRTETRFGISWTWTTFVWLAVIGLVLTGWLGSARRREPLLAAASAAALTAGLGMSTSGHAAAGSGVRIGVDFLHLTAAALWTGGLVALAVLAVPAARRDQHRARRQAVLAACLARFSSVALWLVGALIAAGVYLALVEGRWPVTLHRAWGAALVAKAVLAAGAVALGAYHRWRVVPRLRPRAAGPTRGLGRVGRSLAAEAALAAAALLAAAVLTNLAPRG